MTRLTRRYRFSASHRLHCVSMSDAENAELYGKCNNPFGHGHNYVLEVSVRGPVDSDSGRVVSIGKLDEYVGRKVIQHLDHKDMNRDIPDFQHVVATTENLSVVVERRLRENWKESFAPAALDAVRIQETERNLFEINDL
jgi:6-pyruvoyltetrahydropterin/6-carboxytetrahydropterin synthase